MMIQAISALLVVSLAFTTAEVNHPTCTATQPCVEGYVCRGIQTTAADGTVSAGPHCVSCIPDGADDTCNRNGYLNVVLAGDIHMPENLTPLHCTNDACPVGATCIENLCCYAGNSDGTPVTNDHPICSA